MVSDNYLVKLDLLFFFLLLIVLGYPVVLRYSIILLGLLSSLI